MTPTATAYAMNSKCRMYGCYGLQLRRSEHEEDGSCDYCSCGDPVTNYTMTVEEYAVDGHRWLDDVPFLHRHGKPNGFLECDVRTSVDPMTLSTTDGFYNDEWTAIRPMAFTPFIAIFPSLEFDSWVTIGIDSAPQGSEVPSQLLKVPISLGYNRLPMVLTPQVRTLL